MRAVLPREHLDPSVDAHGARAYAAAQMPWWPNKGWERAAPRGAMAARDHDSYSTGRGVAVRGS